jgi:hypothetical protein
MAEDMEQGEGLSTSKKVVAGAALGVAVPAAVGVARKLMSGGSDDDNGGDDSSEPTSRERSSSRSSSGRSKSSSGRSSSSSGRSRSSSSGRSPSSSSGRSSSSTRSTTKPRAKPNRTREQLYRQATRLKIDGRSSMNKAQLERAIERAKAK